jgi:oligo-1,6-glucosidase
MYILQKGTPFIYQGQEIGMVNMPLPELSLYKDVNTFNAARILQKLLPKKKVLSIIQAGTRENARTPVQWDDSPNAGFTTGKPWFFVNSNYRDINVAAAEADPNSLLHFYRRLLSFRKNNPVVLRGEYREYYPRDKSFYVYERRHFEKRLLVVCCFTAEPARFNAPEGIDLSRWTLELSNYEPCFVIGNGFTSRPYELRVYSFG